MIPKLHSFSASVLITITTITIFFFKHSHGQPSTTGYTCSANLTTYPCKTYAFYRAISPDYLDLASIADLFMVSRLMISSPSNISSPTSPLVPEQPLLVPLSCGCYPTNTTSISYANLSYTIKKGDTFYQVSTHNFQNLTTFQSVIRVNPTFEPTALEVGDNINFPIFCKCPNKTQMVDYNYLVSYVFQPNDNLSSVASLFGVTTESVIGVNGGNIEPFETIFVPVSRLPQLQQPAVSTTPAPPPGTETNFVETERNGGVLGLGIGLGIVGFLLVLVIGMWVWREAWWRRRGVVFEGVVEEKKGQFGGQGFKDLEVNLMADVSDCLDKYRVFKIEELREATDGFRDSCLIHGSVYKGCIDGEVYAIKKMKWNACEELKILQKVNHGNLVKLEGFSIDPEDGNCYLIYEYLENGSLYSLLHENSREKLSWKARLRIAIDVANGLQYIHEHTRPRVVHKDIKSSNILLDSSMRAKIANFGLAKSGCNAITMHIVGTQGYIAPEYIADGVVSTKMDVFSFGVVLLELISGKEAISEEGNVLWAKAKSVLEGTEEQKMNKLRKWMDVVFFVESCSMESVLNVMTVAIACLNRDPAKRPSMVDIVYALCKSDDLFFDISEDGLSAPLILAR